MKLLNNVHCLVDTTECSEGDPPMSTIGLCTENQ